MKKIFKTIFSRFSLIALSVLMQVFIIFFFVKYISDYYYVAYVVVAFSWIILSTLPFRSMPPEGKITWTVLILGLPPFGGILYMMFSKNFISIRHKRMYKRLEVRKNMYNYKMNDYDELMKEHLPLKYFGQMEYIYHCNHQIGFTNTSTKFYPSGEAYFDDLMKELEKAKAFIFIEFFIIEPGLFFDTILSTLEKKVKEGVEVRLIYDDIGSMPKLPLGYDKKLKSLGIKVVRFNRFFPIASAIHNNRDHRKIIVIDGKVGFTGGINLADEYINKTHPFGHWKDSGIKLVGQAVDELTIMFLTSYDLQVRKMDNIDKYLNKYDEQKHDGIIVPYGDGPRPIYQEYVGENVYINMINQAEKYIWITTPYLIIDGKMKAALQNAASRGVDVRIVTPHIPDKKLIFMITRSSYESLQKYGVKIYEYKPGFIHAKQVIADGEVGIVGTINFDYRSLLHHFENAVWMYNTSALYEIKNDFEDIFSKSYNMKNYKQNRLLHVICKVGEVFQPLL